MAVIEIARIQVRRGQENQTGVPTLAGGEFAWAADTEKLYIGLSRQDGGARDDNVEILTENHLRNFFSTLSPITSTSSYTYRVGTYITAQDGINERVRSIQDRLDETDVSIENFGIVAQGGDDSAVLQYAIDNLFLDSLSLPGNPARTLVLPTGTLRVSETIFIPRNTKIVGQGLGKTTILVTSTGSHVFQTVDMSSAGGLGGYITFPSITSGANKPDYIQLEDLSIEINSTVTASQTLSLIQLDCADNSTIRNVRFKGTYITGATTSTNNSAIEIRGFSAVTSENITIENCIFDGLYYGIKSNHDILNTQIHNCKFYNLNRGVVFNDPVDPLALIGPRFARISNNRFFNIEHHAIYAGPNTSATSTNHVSMFNQFVRVGNNGQNEFSTTGTSVIKFSTNENHSIYDYFNRYEIQYQNAGSSITYNSLVEGNVDIALTNGRTVDITSSSTTCVLRIPITGQQQYMTIKYNASSALPVSRSGILDINIGNTQNPDTSITDNYNYVSASEGNLAWSIVKNSASKWLELRATNGDANTLTIEHKSNLMI
jgi:hypothetical protein